jgi:hypothetical protein
MAPRARRQPAPTTSNAYSALVDRAEHSADELIAALEGYTPSPCSQCSKTTTAMAALCEAMRGMGGVIDRFEHSASPRIDALMQDNNANAEAVTERLIAMMFGNTDAHRATTTRLLAVAIQLENLTQLTAENARMNEELLTAHRESRAETAALRDAVADLTRQITGLNATPPPPPSPTTEATTSSAVEEMSLQILNVQRDIQDVLDAVRNPAGKRKRAPSDTRNPVDASPTTPTTRRPTTRKP